MKAEAKEDLGLAWFAVRVGLGLLAISYVFGPAVALAFLAGWLWGGRGKADPSDEEDVKLDDLL